MKHTLSVVVVLVLALSLAVGFVACGAQPQNQTDGPVLTYVDKEGKTVNVNVQETKQPEQVTDVLVALANQEVADPTINTLMADVRATLAATVTEGEAYRLDADIALQVGLNIPKIKVDSTFSTLINEAAPYLALSVKGHLPIDEKEDGGIDYGSITALDESARVYYADSAVYANLHLSDQLKAKLGTADFDVDAYLDTDAKLDLSPVMGLADYMINVSEVTQLVPDFEGGNAIDVMADLFGTEVEVNAQAEDVEMRRVLADMVQKLDLSITHTQNNAITFRATVTQGFAIELVNRYGAWLSNEIKDLDVDALKEVLASYDGSSYIAATFDAATMRFVGLEVEVKALANCLVALAAKQEAGTASATATAISIDKATFAITLAYNQAVPALSEQQKQEAVDVGNQLSKLKGLFGGGLLN